ncbi:hypothetical protein ACO0J5_19175, partial [Proteus mirabilis]
LIFIVTYKINFKVRIDHELLPLLRSRKPEKEPSALYRTPCPLGNLYSIPPLDNSVLIVDGFLNDFSINILNLIGWPIPS